MCCTCGRSESSSAEQQNITSQVVVAVAAVAAEALTQAQAHQ